MLHLLLLSQSRQGAPTTYQVTLVTLGKILQRVIAELKSVKMMLVREGRRLAELGAGQSFFLPLELSGFSERAGPDLALTLRLASTEKPSVEEVHRAGTAA